MARKRKQVRLRVLLEGQGIGTLGRASSGGLEFTYLPEWLAAKDAIPVSRSIPLRDGTFRDERVVAFFDNLLPDNEQIRTRIAERFATAGKGTLDLLAAIGRDCVGALQFVPEGESIPGPAPLKLETLSASEIAGILQNLKASPLGLDRNREFRISIAGAQEKTALTKHRGRWYRPGGTTPTTHILKPSMGQLPSGIDMRDSVYNEWFCLRLCEHLGLPVAKAEVGEFDGVTCLIVERFDREWSRDKKRIHRLHQEDICQALGVPWSRKYQSDGGPGIVQIMKLLDASDLRDQDRAQFMRSQIVFFLLGAIDGHAKNFSLRFSPTGFSLTPVYDVMSVLPALADGQLQPKEAKLAMSVGDNRHYLLREIRRRHWEQTAKAVGFSRKELDALIADLVARIDGLEATAKEDLKEVPKKMGTALIEGIGAAAKAIRS
jgi:serine/threonine-protein kinase HipA